MSEYLSYDDVEAMSRSLKAYDIGQNAWEHEQKGLEFNVDHTLKELVRARRKDFFNPEVVQSDLAPDAMQYALRIARWAGFKQDLVLPTTEIRTAIDAHAKLTRSTSRRTSAYDAGEVMLADFTHKLDHETERDKAYQTKFLVLPRVSQALVLFALESANEFGFRPVKAFDDRLTNLRERFGLSQPV